MNDDVIQAGVLKEFFSFLGSKGITVNVTPIIAAELIDQVFKYIVYTEVYAYVSTLFSFAIQISK